MSEPLPVDAVAIVTDPARAVIEIERLRAEVDRLRDEITDRTNVEADLRAQLAEEKAKRL